MCVTKATLDSVFYTCRCGVDKNISYKDIAVSTGILSIPKCTSCGTNLYLAVAEIDESFESLTNQELGRHAINEFIYSRVLCLESPSMFKDPLVKIKSDPLLENRLALLFENKVEYVAELPSVIKEAREKYLSTGELSFVEREPPRVSSSLRKCLQDKLASDLPS